MQSRNNTAFAKEHRIIRLENAVKDLKEKNSNIKEKVQYLLKWLSKAEAFNSHLDNRFRENPLSASSKHISLWRATFESFVKDKGLV